MSESEEGVSVNWTRQKAGRLVMAFGALAPPAGGGVNWPLVTAVATVTFAFVSLSEAASVSHVAALARPGTATRHETKAIVFMTRILMVIGFRANHKGSRTPLRLAPTVYH